MTERRIGDNGGPPLEEWVAPPAPSFILQPWRDYTSFIINPYRFGGAAFSTFRTVLWNGTGSAQSIDAGFSPDLVISKRRATAVGSLWVDNVRGATIQWSPPSTAAESTVAQGLTSFDASGFSVGTDAGWNATTGGTTYVGYCFEETAGFFDIVTYTGNGTSGRTVAHTLGVAPELMIVKSRSALAAAQVYHSATGNTKATSLQATGVPSVSAGFWNNTTPDAANFTLGNGSTVNGNTTTYVAYLFASLAGRSKVGSYTGDGAASGPSVTCGFSPSFIIIRRTDAAGDWYVFDTTRDASPINTYFLMNSSAGEATAAFDVTTDASGFQLTNAATSVLNVSGGTYIFIAIR